MASEAFRVAAVSLFLGALSFFSSSRFSEGLISKTLLNRSIQTVSVVNSSTKLEFSSITLRDFQEQKNNWYVGFASSFISSHLAGQTQLYSADDKQYIFYIPNSGEIFRVVKSITQVARYIKSISV